MSPIALSASADVRYEAPVPEIVVQSLAAPGSIDYEAPAPEVIEVTIMGV